MAAAKKAIIIGMDSIMLFIIKDLIRRGKMNTMASLMDKGVSGEILPVFPTNSAPNWVSATSGAYPATHGVTDMVVHIVGEPLSIVHSGFYSFHCKAERVWEAAEREGKIPVLLKFTTSWPPTINKGIQIDGFGSPGGPGPNRPWGSNPLALSPSSCFCTYRLPHATPIRLEKREKPFPIIKTKSPVFESKIKICDEQFSLYIVNSTGDNYDTAILLAQDGDSADGILKMTKGEWSKWITREFNKGGKKVKGTFRCKLLELSQDARRLKLYVSQIFQTEGYTHPEKIAHELFENVGPYLEYVGHFPYLYGWIDHETYLEEAEYQADWLASAANYLLTQYSWDIFLTQWHSVDFTQHAFLTYSDEKYTETENILAETLIEQDYELADKLVEKLLRLADENTVIMILSDHGQIAGKKRFFINNYLARLGLLTIKKETSGNVTVDWHKTKAYAQGMIHVFINLKGREPEGIVTPQDYGKVQKEIINALHGITDSITDERPISLALKKDDSENLGLGGNTVGDIIYACTEGYYSDPMITEDLSIFKPFRTIFGKGASIHGHQLPTVDLGNKGTMKGMFIFAGPGFKKGFERKKPLKIVDVIPTLCHVLKWSPPAQSEGSIAYDLLE